MKKITLLIAFLLSAMLSGYAQQVQSYTRTVLTGQTYTPITGGTVINTLGGLTPGLISTSQDDGGVIVTLPFTFTYGTGTYTQATFVTNGWVGMGNMTGISASNSYTSGNLFSTTAANNVIAAWYGDLGGNFPQGPGSMVHGLVGTDVYAFEWRNVVGNGTAQSNNTINFMIKLYGPASATPGRIELLYGAANGNVTIGRSLGIENPTGGVGNFINALNGSNHLTTVASAWPGNGNGYRFDPASSACTAPTGGTIVGGTSIYACSGSAPATIMTSGVTPSATGVAYQWEQSTDGGTTWVIVTGGSGATTPNYTPGTFSGTATQYRLKVTCGTLTGYSEVASLAAAGSPGTQVSGLSVQASQASGLVLNWTNGNGNRRVVLVSTTPIVDPTSGSGPALTTATTLTTNGAQQVLYDGTGTTVTATGVTCAGGTYYIKVYEVIRCGASAPYTYNYNLVSSAENMTMVTIPSSATAPSTQASGLTVIDNNAGLALSWIAGTGTRRAVYISNTPIVDPVDGTGAALTATAAYAGTGQQLVYDGTGTSVNVTGIPCTTAGTYYIKVVEYFRCGPAAPFEYAYNTTAASNAVTHVRVGGSAAPAVQASALVLTKGVGSFTAYWNNGSAERRVVYVSTSPITAPVNGSGPVIANNASLASGSDPWIVYDGTGNNITVTNVPCSGGTYYVQVFEYNRCGSGPYDYAYNTTTGTNAATIDMSLEAPATQATNLVVTNAPGSLTANFTRGSGNRVMVIVSDSLISDPVDSFGEPVLPTATVFAGGQQTVYDGTGTSVTVTGIPCADGTYYVKVIEYNRCGSGPYDYAYNTEEGSNIVTNVVTFAAPTQQVAGLTINPALNSAVLSWANGNGSRRRVIVSSTPIANPTDEFGVAEITASAFYQGGQQNVYDGTGSTVTVSGLSCSTTYFVKVYEYFRCGATGNYTYVYNTTGTANAGSIVTTGPMTAVALPQATTFAGFTGDNLSTVFPNWKESAIPTTAGTDPLSSNPSGTTSNWVNSSVLGSPTAKVNLYLATRNEWIISPRMNITAAARLKFKAAMTDFGNPNVVEPNLGMADSDDKVTVLISTDACGEQWTPIYEFNSTNVLSNQLTQFEFPINGSYIGQSVYIAFQATDGPVDELPDYDFHIGDVRIELVPSCDIPTTITDPVSLVTENGATVAWSAPTTGSPTGYQYVFSQTNTAPTGAGTDVANTSITSTTLTHSTTYYTWVRSVCTGPLYSNWIMVGSFRTLCDAPELTNPAATPVCGQGTSTLSATASDGGVVNWYATATSSTILGTGNFVTPTLNATTSYFASAASYGAQQSVGRTAPAAGTGSSASTNYGIVVNASTDTFLESVTVYSTTAGTLNVKIMSGTTELYATGNVNIVAGATTPNVIPLNFMLPQGNGYRIVIKASSGVSLLRDDTGLAFPYAGSDGTVTIPSSDWIGATTLYYYYFYDLKYKSVCTSPRTEVVATVSTAPPVTASTTDDQICAGESTSISAASSNAGYTYTWMPGNLTGPTQTVSPAATTTYTVTGTDTVSGCVTTATVVVTVNPLPLPIVITPATGSICPGSSVTLSIPTGPQQKTFGTGTDVNTTSTYPAPYSTYYGGTKHQMLYRASELTAMGFVAGSSITKIGFMISSVGNAFTGTLNDFSISMGHTPNTVLNSTAFIGGLTTVLPAAAATIPTTGLPATVTHTFATPFVWNGLDNIVVQTSYSNNILGTVNHAVIMLNSNAGFVSTNWYRADSVTAAAILSAATPTSSVNARPNTIFTVDNPGTLTWSPAEGLNTTTGGSVIASPTATTTYTVTSTSPAGCTVTANVTVTVNNANTPTGSTSQVIAINEGETATIEDIVVTETGVIWYATEADAIGAVSPLAAGTVLQVGSTYYGTLSTGSCVPLAVTITEILGSKGFDKSSFSYYPNPVKNVLNLKYSNEMTNVEVYNLLGQKVISKDFNATEAALDMSGVADGTYIVRVISGNIVESIKVVKKQ